MRIIYVDELPEINDGTYLTYSAETQPYLKVPLGMVFILAKALAADNVIQWNERSIIQQIAARAAKYGIVEITPNVLELFAPETTIYERMKLIRAIFTDYMNDKSNKLKLVPGLENTSLLQLLLVNSENVAVEGGDAIIEEVLLPIVAGKFRNIYVQVKSQNVFKYYLDPELATIHSRRLRVPPKYLHLNAKPYVTDSTKLNRIFQGIQELDYVTEITHLVYTRIIHENPELGGVLEKEHVKKAIEMVVLTYIEESEIRTAPLSSFLTSLMQVLNINEELRYSVAMYILEALEDTALIKRIEHAANIFVLPSRKLLTIVRREAIARAMKEVKK
ncbi:MAG: hypothetical protein DRJ40_10795 [Thermoprotei archaeon]|nr:MAG: hypothetical protein DRJ40_10795 [Thermoprotei archaeon]